MCRFAPVQANDQLRGYLLAWQTLARVVRIQDLTHEASHVLGGSG
jgi:hypothetical protein